MTPPRPAALRLWTRAAEARAPKPPLGLAAWSVEAQALAVLLDATGIDPEDVARLAEQIPCAADLEAATPVFVFGDALRRRRALRWLGVRKVPVSRATRCTALLVRGYVGVAASTDASTGADLAWGFSSPC